MRAGPASLDVGIPMAYVTRRHPDVVVQYRVPYKVYARLARATDNRHLKMAYHDGTLEVLSFRPMEHEVSSRWLGIVVRTVAERLGFDYDGAGGATFHRAGDGPFKGKGKEPDESFYLATARQLPHDRELNLDSGDPPPDLWIEVDDRHSPQGRFRSMRPWASPRSGGIGPGRNPCGSSGWSAILTSRSTTVSPCRP
jgi:hypothetical protein